jgi:hypothetical protein
MKPRMTLIGIAGCLLLFVGCATDTHAPPDPSMATIKGTSKEIGAFNFDVTTILTIDGQPVGWASHLVKMPAGTHQIGISFVSRSVGYASGVFPFELEAGKVYRFEVFIGDSQKLFLREVLESGMEDLAINTLPLVVTPGKTTATTFSTIMIYRRR